MENNKCGWFNEMINKIGADLKVKFIKIIEHG